MGTTLRSPLSTGAKTIPTWVNRWPTESLGRHIADTFQPVAHPINEFTSQNVSGATTANTTTDTAIRTNLITYPITGHGTEGV